MDSNHNPEVVVYATCKRHDIENWLREIEFRRDKKQRLVLNASHFEVVRKVANRVCDEMDAMQSEDFSTLNEPLRWLMHGGPGAGKTHVI